MRFNLKRIINIFFLLFLIPLAFGQTDEEQALKIKQAYDAMFESELPVNEKIDSVLSINDYWRLDPNEAFRIVKRGFALSKNNPNLKQHGLIHREMGRAYLWINQPDSSIIIYNKTISIFQKAGDVAAQSDIYVSMLDVYSLVGKADSSIASGYKAEELCLSVNDEKCLVKVYYYLMAQLNSLGKDQEAIEVGKKALGLSKKIKLHHFTVVISGYLPLPHRALGDTKGARSYLDAAFQAIEENRKALGEDYCNRHSGYLYFESAKINLQEKKYDLALLDLEKSYKFRVQGKNMRHNVYELDLKGQILFEKKDIKNANKTFRKLYDHPQIKERGFLKQAMIGLIKTYAIQKQYDSVYVYRNALDSLDISDKLHESTLKMEELKTEYETEKKEATIAAQEEQLSQQRTIQWLMIGLAGILGLLFFQSYRNAQTRKRNNEKLEKTNALLGEKNKENELLLKEIHHRVKNNLQTISSLLSLQSNTIEDQNALDAVQESRNRVASMALIHQKLYQGENLAGIEMRDYFETVGQAIIDSFGEQAEGVELQVEMPEIELDVDTAIPIGLITNELITNSLKYAFENKETGKISISMQQLDNDLVQLYIADDGENKSEGISAGGTGFGSMLINLLTTQLGGKLKQSTEDGTSTLIEFKFKENLAA